MRIDIAVDDKLIKDAMRCSGASTKREAVEIALRLLVRLKSQEEVLSLRGQLRWEGDLASMRQSGVLRRAN
ncbi:MAG: type II toxin-antitoxin system VapB family antitoxin [Caldilineaceae bacterium]|nr:type II toxin-antitoxin system VapB family antitoxin [Caldilineaceae bacterium]MDE0339145.1 type II toxin-antitoxin system VapB family antitoxin [Caldilineaceae bacterium]